MLPCMRRTHEDYMLLAIEAAREAESLGDIPIGAVLVLPDGEVVRAFNRREIDEDPLAHAEMLAISEAARRTGSWRLEDARLYVTLEPCPMCAGAIILSRIGTVVFGASDPKAGCCGSLMDLLKDTRFNHQPEVVPGVLAEACGALLTDFFRRVRERKRAAKREAADS